jgi:hypothetical protein
MANDKYLVHIFIPLVGVNQPMCKDFFKTSIMKVKS